MTWARMFWKVTRWARAVRFWLLLAVALLAWVGLGEARAAQCGMPSKSEAFAAAGGGEVYAYEGEARAACESVQGWHSEQVGGIVRRLAKSGACEPVAGNQWRVRVSSEAAGGERFNVLTGCEPLTPSVSGSDSVTGWKWINPGCPAGKVWNESTKTCEEDCSARSSTTWDTDLQFVNGATSCDDGCVVVWSRNPTGTGYVGGYGAGVNCTLPTPVEACTPAQLAAGWRNSTSVMNLCLPPAPQCAAGQTRNAVTGECDDSCPAGMYLDPLGQCTQEPDACPAGQTRAPDGSCTGDNSCPAGQVRGPDGTCKPDADDDGEPDEDADDQFSGGDNCDQPPLCSGDVIMCGMARIQWRIECNTRKDTKVSGGSCDTIPLCVGRNCDALEYAQLLQQWRASCAVERMANGAPVGDGGDGGDGEGHSCGPGHSDAECEASQNIGDEGDGSDAIVEREYLEDGFDDSGYGWAESCPTVPSVEVFGHTIDFGSKLGPLCEWFQLGGVFVMIVAGIGSLMILLRV